MAQKRILVVEDDAIIAQDIKQSLESLKYEVAGTAASGEEAIKKAAKLKPNLVLMDIVLKGTIDGIKAAGHIFSQFNIPVVYLTSHSDKATLKRAKETEPFGYLMKPFEIKDMAATLEMALYKHGMEHRLKENEQWLSIILRSIGDAVIVTDSASIVEFMNPASEVMTGWSSQKGVGKPLNNIFKLTTEDGKEILKEPVQLVIKAQEQVDLSDYKLMVGKGGREALATGNAAPLVDDKNEVTGVVFVFHDITEAHETMKALEKSESFLSTIFDSIRDPFCIMDSKYIIVKANEAYAELKNFEVHELVGKDCHETIYTDNKECENSLVSKTFKSTKPNSHEQQVELSDGTKGWVESFTYPIFDSKGKVTHVIEYSRDISERTRADEERRRLIKELEYLSRIDSLTGLLNRRAFMDAMMLDFQRAKRYGRELSVMLCDIDSFKEINDTYGHQVGDEALQKVSEVLKEMVRSTDVLGRYGGDEFIIVMPETPLKGVKEFAERVREKIEQVTLKTAKLNKSGKLNKSKLTPIKITLSIGVSIMEPKKDSPDYLITRADAAMYASKHQGRNRVSVIEP